jgi:hypothetical protein
MREIYEEAWKLLHDTKPIFMDFQYKTQHQIAMKVFLETVSSEIAQAGSWYLMKRLSS